MHACHLYTAGFFHLFLLRLSCSPPHPNLCNPTRPPRLHLAVCPFATAAAFTDKDQSDHQFTDKQSKHINTTSLCVPGCLVPSMQRMDRYEGLRWGLFEELFSPSAPNALAQLSVRNRMQVPLVAGVNCC